MILIDERMNFINCNPETSDEAIRMVSDRAVELGYSGEQFYRELILREEEFPTGIDVSIPMAMPHVMSGCSKSFMSVATFQKPVSFRKLGAPGEIVDAEIMFLFGVTDPEEGKDLFCTMVDVLQDRTRMEQLCKAADSRDCCSILEDLFGGSVIRI